MGKARRCDHGLYCVRHEPYAQSIVLSSSLQDAFGLRCAKLDGADKYRSRVVACGIVRAQV